MSDDESNSFQELNERLDTLFDVFKQKLNTQQYPNVESLLYNVHNKTDTLLLQIKYEINRILGTRIKEEELVDPRKIALNQKKAECLIKLQSLTSELTCRIMGDYKQTEEERRKGPRQ